MTERLLVVLDGDERGPVALDAAERLADLCGVGIDVLALTHRGSGPASPEATIERQTAAIKARPDVTVRAAVSTLPSELEDAIEATSETLIVMATSFRRDTVRVADAVLRSHGGATLLIGPRAFVPPDWPSGPMIVCADGSVSSEAIIPHAAAFSRALDLEPQLVTVHDHMGVLEPVVPLAGDPDSDAPLAPRLGTALGSRVGVDVLRGAHPAEAIVAYARASGAGIIALATHGLTEASPLVFASVSSEVVREAHSPVLVARTDA